MTIFAFTNYAAGELAQSLTGVDTTLQVGAGQGAFFPVLGPDQMASVVVQNEAAWEVMHVTAIVGDVFTVIRAREGTTAQNFPVGSVIEMRVTRGLLENFTQRDQVKEVTFAYLTRLLFNQSVAPLFWVKDTAAGLNDRALRVTTGVITSSGNLPFSQAFTSRGLSGAVQAASLTVAQLPPHSHPITLTPDADRVVFFQRGSFTGYVNENSANPNASGYQLLQASAGSVGAGEVHNHGLTLSNLDLNVQYLDCIICAKAA